MTVDAQSAWAQGARLFEAGAYWECHEALEPLWLEAKGKARAARQAGKDLAGELDEHFYGGIILLAAALHKARQMASPRGGRRNYAKALAHLALVPDNYRGVRVRELEARVHAALRDASLRPAIPYVSEGEFCGTT